MMRSLKSMILTTLGPLHLPLPLCGMLFSYITCDHCPQCYRILLRHHFSVGPHWISYLYVINQHKLMLLKQRILAFLHTFLRSWSGEKRHSGQSTNNFPDFHQEGHRDVFCQLSGTTEYLLGGGFMSIIYWQAWFNFFSNTDVS